MLRRIGDELKRWAAPLVCIPAPGLRNLCYPRAPSRQIAPTLGSKVYK